MGKRWVMSLSNCGPQARIVCHMRAWSRMFTEYLANERLKRAKQYLADLTLSINEVARLVGYDDPSYFTRWFRQREQQMCRD